MVLVTVESMGQRPRRCFSFEWQSRWSNPSYRSSSGDAKGKLLVAAALSYLVPRFIDEPNLVSIACYAYPSASNRLQIVLPRTPEPITLGHLRHEIASITSLPFEKIKLIHKGLVMRDDRLPLAAYGLHEGSRIGLVGSREEGDKPGAKTSVGIGALSVGEQKAREKKAREADTSEQGLLARITEALETSRKDLFPEVELVERSVDIRWRNVNSSNKEAKPPLLRRENKKGKRKC